MSNDSKNHNYFDSIKKGYSGINGKEADRSREEDGGTNVASKFQQIESDVQLDQNVICKNASSIESEVTTGSDIYENGDTNANPQDDIQKESDTSLHAGARIVQDNLDYLHLPSMSVDFREYLHISDYTRNSLVVNHLFVTSEVFLKKAHKSVLVANSTEGSKHYYKMIKLSIKALLILVKRYPQCLNPQLESIAYFKLAKIYFTETENLNKADDYVNKAMAVSSRNNLINLKFISEFLAAQILEKTNANLLLHYLNEKINNYRSIGLNNFANLFQFIKINNLLVLDYSTGLVVLQSIIQDPDVDRITKVLCMLHQSNMHLYRGSPSESSGLLREVESLLLTSKIEFPVQLKAMHYLSKLLMNIQVNDVEGTEKCMKDINLFITSERNNKWRSWREDGNFRINVPINVNNSTSKFSYQVSWLSSDDFVIMFYFFLGMSLLAEAHNGKRKAKKVFDKCLQIIEKQSQELTMKVKSSRNFPLNQLNSKLLKLNFIKFNINYYQVWMNFLMNNFNDISPLNEFMSRYNNNDFSSEELCYYRLLLPKLFYIFGIYYHSTGDLAAAKYYFMKVRNFSSAFKKPEDKTISILQLALGLGSESFSAENEFSELYVFASLHLIIINEYELKKVSNLNQNQNKDLINELHKFGTILYEDLSKVFGVHNKTRSNTFTTNFTSSNKLIQITYHVLLLIFNDLHLKDNGSGVSDQLQSKIKELINTIEDNKVTKNHPFINNLILIIIYQYVRDLNKRNEYFQKCFSLLSETNGSDSGKVLQMFVLQLFEKNIKATGNEDKAQMIELQLKVLQNAIHKKFELTQIYINTITN